MGSMAFSGRLGVSQGLQVSRETRSVFFLVGVSAASLPQSNLESWLR